PRESLRVRGRSERCQHHDQDTQTSRHGPSFLYRIAGKGDTTSLLVREILRPLRLRCKGNCKKTTGLSEVQIPPARADYSSSRFGKSFFSPDSGQVDLLHSHSQRRGVRSEAKIPGFQVDEQRVCVDVSLPHTLHPDLLEEQRDIGCWRSCTEIQVPIQLAF